jgi:hypothetical protein
MMNDGYGFIPGFPQPRLARMGATYQVGPPGASAVNFDEMLLRDNSPDLGGQTWLVQLNAWRPSQSSTTILTPTRNQLTVFALTAIVTTGIEGANEELTVDYPQTGTSFAVQGQSFQLRLAGRPGTLPTDHSPLLSVGAVVDSGVGAARNMTATLTTTFLSLSANGGGNQSGGFFIPVRARAFRLLWQLPVGATTLNLLQQDQAGNPLIADQTGLTGGENLPSSRAQWYPLHPLAQQVSITNLDGLNSAKFALQWLLETCA